ncbi:MAG: hypothetical protein Q9166_007854, partial [cf. Caloplaca sp. 2 TL-2023]
MEGEKACVALKTVYDEVLLAFEEALDEADNLASTQTGLQPRELKTWLENATTSLISWGIDTRANTGSLAAVEGTPVGVEVRCRLLELQQNLGGFLDSRSSRWVSSNSDSTELTSSPNPIKDNLIADGDPIANMSSLVGDLQDFVRPIRMMHASQTREGPYRALKHQVDDIYSRYAKPRAHAESLTHGTNPAVALRDQRSVGDVLPDLGQGSIAPGFSHIDPPSMRGAVFMKDNASTENLQQPIFESAEGIHDYNLDLSSTEDLWGNVGTALRSSCEENWHGAHFIAPKAFSQIMSTMTVRRLLQSLQPVSMQLSGIYTVDSVVLRRCKVLAICLYARLAPLFFCYLMECFISDRQLPIGDDVLQIVLSSLPEDIDQKIVRRFCVAQWVFLPVQIRFDDAPAQYESSAVLPIQCDPDKDFLGHGAFGNVYKVRISSNFQEPNAQAEVFAMKRLIGLPNVDTATLSPKSISKHMKKLEHPNLVQHVKFWVTGQNSYILFPLAANNLRQLFNDQTPPSAPTEQKKLLNQMHKIVGALKFLHSHGSSKVAQNQFLHNRKTSISGAHMNIRPENIQITRGEDDLNIWKLADFGIPNSGGISYSSPDVIPIASQITGDRPNIGELHDVFALGGIFLELAVWLLGAEDQTLRRQLSDLGDFWYIPMPNGPAELKHEVTVVIGRMKQEWTDVIWLKRMVDLVQSTLEVDFQRRLSISVVEDRLANILASVPGLGHAEPSCAVEYDLDEIEGSESSFDAFDDPHSGTGTPDTIDSMIEDDGLQVRMKWQTRRMYPFLLHGLEPEPIHDEVVTTFEKIIDSKNDPAPLDDSNNDNESAIQHAILRSLRFPGMNFPESTVADLHGSTISWVYKDSESDFVRWLNNKDEPVFWIQGYPGSGKSTMMKYIAQNQGLQQMGERRRDNPPLQTITHFFSTRGTAMHNSQTGFLRSLLYQIFLQRMNLLPTLFVEFWETAAKCSTGMLRALPEAWHNWSVSQLRRLLHALLTNLGSEEGFLVFIDGLDECESTDLKDIILLGQHLSSLGNFKICLASRPDHLISQAFHSTPQIVLQYSTENEIEKYAKDLLSSLPLIANPVASDRVYVESLIKRIVLQSGGVFLWVNLAVESLLRGYTDGDSLLEIRGRLDRLPTALEGLYRDMLGRIDECHRVEAMIYLLIMAKAWIPLSLEAFVFTIGEQDMFDEQSVKEPMDADSRCSWALKLSARTCGLAVVESTGSGHDSRIRFMHMTVQDFLSASNTRAELEVAAAKRGFDVNVALLRASIFQVRKLKSSTPDWEEEWKDTIESAIYYARKAENSTGQAQTALLDTLNRVAGGAILPASLSDGDHTPSSTSIHWAAAIMHEFDDNSCGYCPSSFLAFAVMSGLTLYVETKLHHMTRQGIALEPSLLLDATLAIVKHDKNALPLVPMVEKLLQSGAGPNVKVSKTLPEVKVASRPPAAPFKAVEQDLVSGKTPWTLIVEYLAYNYDQKHEDEWCQVCMLFLKYGADRSVHVRTTEVLKNYPLDNSQQTQLLYLGSSPPLPEAPASKSKVDTENHIGNPAIS